jgi:ABC-2 type transport system permease protein
MNTLVHSMPMPRRTSMPWSRLVRAYVMESRYELVRQLRMLPLSLPMLVVPALIYLLFGVVISHDAIQKMPALADLLFIGFAILAIAAPALFSIGCGLAMERDQGLMKLKRAMPAPPGGYVLAKMLTSLAFSVMAVAVMIPAGLYFGHLTMSGTQILMLAAVLIGGCLPFCAIGLFIGTHVSGSASPGVANVVYLPMMWLSGLFIPLPAFLQPWQALWPTYHLQQVAFAATGLHSFQSIHPAIAAAVLLGITALFGALSIRRLARKG